MPASNPSATFGPSCPRCGRILTGRPGETVCPHCLLDMALDSAPADHMDETSWLDGVEDDGTRTGPYEILEEIARGGMGVVYRARHRGLNRIVALKMILPQQLQSAAAIQRFRGEAEAVAALDHPGILPIYEVGELDGLPFFSMKLAEGGSLASQLATWRDRPRDAARLIAHVARAVHHAHERGILHRDLKPGNILLSREGEAYVTDFGIAKWIGRDTRLTQDASTLGTPHYIAPEQAAGSSAKLTPAADVYSLGAILYELVAGRPPFVAETALETLRLVTDTAPPSPRIFNAAIPRELELICLKCLEKEPAARYSSAAELAQDLERWLEGETVTARAATPVEKTWRWAKRNRALAVACAALLITLLGAGFFAYFGLSHGRPNTASLSENSIAVLPFVDLSQAKDQEYFCDGISEELLDKLAKIEGLRVVSRTSSFSFKGKNADLAEIARKLNVQSVLEGSVRRDGNRVRIIAQLVNVRDGLQLWSETYERELKDIFAVQDDITKAIVDALKVKLAAALPAQKQRDSEAYDLYLRGLYFSNKSSEEDLRKSLNFFQRALDKDPNFARAWTGMAKAWLWLADEYVKPLEAYPLVQAAASKAIALDERQAEAYAYLGESDRVLNWDYHKEESELRHAIEIDPNCAPAHLFLALLLGRNGPSDQAFAELDAAKRLDPLSPIVSNFIGELCLAANRFDDAVAEGQRMVELDPAYSYLDDSLAAAYRERGQLAEAITIYEKAETVTHVPRPGLAIAYARAGRLDDARRVLAQLIERAKTQYVAADGIASIYVAFGDKDEAFRWLNRAVDEHSAPLGGIGPRITFRPLRSDSRFADVLRRINLDSAKLLSPK
jgi:eukaryotic-like serine/threonine-protein kinase